MENYNNNNGINTFIVIAILIMFGIIGWAIWHHFEDEHDVYRIEGPGWRYEYRDNYRRYDRPYYRGNGVDVRPGRVEVGPTDIRWR